MANPLANPQIRIDFGFDLELRVNEMRGWNTGLTELEMRRIIPYQLNWEMLDEEKVALEMADEHKRFPQMDLSILLKLYLLERFFSEFTDSTDIIHRFLDEKDVKEPYHAEGKWICRDSSGISSPASLSRIVMLESENARYAVGCRVYSRRTFNYFQQRDMARRILKGGKTYFLGVMALNQFADLCNPALKEADSRKKGYINNYLGADWNNCLLVFSKTNQEIQKQADYYYLLAQEILSRNMEPGAECPHEAERRPIIQS